MSRLSTTFQVLKGQRKTALIPYFTAGDPQPGSAVDIMNAMVESGADIIEVGVPFSDPMADGPAIQAACERALRHGVSLSQVLDMVALFRTKNQQTPVVLMGYLNPIEVMGYGLFAERAKKAGVDGVLTVDLPPEEATDLVAALNQQDVDPIFLIAPTSTDERVRRIAQCASGFLYYVSLKGVTGSSRLNVHDVKQKMVQLRDLTSLPIGVGFGINDPQTAAEVAQFSDAVVVGSAVVKRIESLQDKPAEMLVELSAFVASLRAAIDGRV